ncbi:hypothetical protein J437_LFUL004120 [Ladona fulva]|uniref:Protein KRI1 homolog n=1 Tax=Ladona fulva TaxID=123851 RepID=A0A8K0NVW3_LADFU|nr:hypothetical protein J437_LFUL004120 [Ladona fulva]
MPKKLLEDEDSSAVSFNINKSYADNYDSWRRKEELQKYKDRYGKDALEESEEGCSSSSSSDEETDVEANEAFDKEFYHTLSCLKAKDPKIYDKEVNFFENADKKAENDEKKSNKKSKPMYLRDYERKLILEKGGVLSDEDEALDNDDEKEEQVHSPSYYEEQEAIKKSFKKALTDNGVEEENSIGGLFSRKMKTSEEEAKEADEYAAWLQGRKDELQNEEEAKTLSYLRSYWTDPSLDEGEAFLRDYILEKKFTHKGKEKRMKKEKSPVESEGDQFELEEQEIQKIEEFEQKYNFRFEEPDQDTLRRQDDRRKEKRKDLKTRKELEIEKKKEELRKAKEFKRKEIEEKLKQLCSITGNPEIGFKGEDLDEDFDPEEHDRRMNELFSQDDFYAEPEDQKPEFPEFDEELEIEDWDEWGESGEGNNTNEFDSQDPNVEDPNFNMDCDYDPTANDSVERAPKGRKAKRERGRRRRGVSSKLAEGLAKEKPVFDPIAYLSKNPQARQSEAFEKYVDEYYGLDFEDVIGGDLPCRFKYRKVVPNDYGLTVAEILAADDKELNRWCSLKKALRIKPVENEKYDLQAYRKKGSNVRLKQKIFPSLFTNHEDETVAPKKKSKKMSVDNSKDKKQNIDNGGWKVSNVEESSEEEKHENIETTVESGNNDESCVQEVNDGVGRKKRKMVDSEGEVETNKETSVGERKKSKKKFKGLQKSKGKKSSDRNDYFSNITKSRLKAYGINPKKFRNKLKYKNSQ